MKKLIALMFIIMILCIGCNNVNFLPNDLSWSMDKNTVSEKVNGQDIDIYAVESKQISFYTYKPHFVYYFNNEDEFCRIEALININTESAKDAINSYENLIKKLSTDWGTPNEQFSDSGFLEKNPAENIDELSAFEKGYLTYISVWYNENTNVQISMNADTQAKVYIIRIIWVSLYAEEQPALLPVLTSV